MKLDKYYDELFVDGKVNSNFVTYLSCVHLYNKLVKRDRTTNKELEDLGRNYNSKFHNVYQNINAPLGFIEDDVLSTFNYSLYHIKSILKNPHNQIIKEKKLVEKSKLKDLDSKSLNWLSTKPGMTIREKMANVDKVASTVKRFSLDVKENQVVVAYYRSIRKLLLSKISAYKNNPELFGKDDGKLLDLCNHELNKIENALKDEFEEVKEKYHTTPNNALIGNVDYAAVWKSYLDIKNVDIDYENSFETFKHVIFNCLVLYLLNAYDFVEDFKRISSVYEYKLLSFEANTLKEIVFDQDFTITINSYDLSQSKSELKETQKIQINMELKEEESNRGLPFNLYINDGEAVTFYADLLGAKELINYLVETISFKHCSKLEEPVLLNKVDLVSINSFDNKYYGDTTGDCRLAITNKGNFITNKIYDIGQNINYLNRFESNDYHSLISMLEKKTDLQKNSIIIYDICDDYDQFSSAQLRRTFSSVFSKSYPVWRSILAAEAFGENFIKMVVDLCGDELVTSKLDYKNNRFVHYGAQEIPTYINSLSEIDFNDNYIRKFMNIYGSIPHAVCKDFIESGNLYNVLMNKGKTTVYYQNTYYQIFYDENIFNSCKNDFITELGIITEEYGKYSLYVLPDFIEDDSINFIHNNQLYLGAQKIINYVKNHEITWYEILPELSLEIIKDGAFDSIKLVDNQETENVIGKSFKVHVNDTFTLKAGLKDFKLPLNKSFVGEKNKNFVAYIKDNSFPLKEDVKVSLDIVYDSNNENSYDLSFTPLTSNAPFKKIKAEWQEELNINKPIKPNILDIVYNPNEIEKEIQNLEYKIGTFKIQTKFYLDNPKSFEQEEKVIKTLSIITNMKQRIDFSGYSKYAAKAKALFNDKDFLMYLNDLCHSFYKRYCYRISKNYDISPRFIYEYGIIEQAYVEVNYSKKLLKSEMFIYPEYVMGRYIAKYPNDYEILDKSYKILLKCARSKPLFGTPLVHNYLDRLRAASIVDHLAFSKACETHPMFVLKISKIVLQMIKEIISVEWKPNKDKLLSGREAFFKAKDLIDLLMSILYCTDYDLFETLRPNGNLSNEIVYYLKVLSKKIVTYLDKIEDPDVKQKLSKTIYKMNDQRPPELYNTYPMCYHLILFLTGDDRANYIRIEKNEN